MPEGTLKCIILLDPETRAYKPISHNLNANLAAEQFSADPNAKIIDQASHHRSSDVRRCKSCSKAALNATREYNKSTRQRGSEEPAAAIVEESESD